MAWRAERVTAGLGLSDPVHELREIVNAIVYVNRAGCAWHLLPTETRKHEYYAKWEKDGTVQVIHDLLRRRVRERAGRAAEPTAAITGAQSVKTSGNVAEASQGIDAGFLTHAAASGIAFEAVAKPDGQKGFAPLPRR